MVADVAFKYMLDADGKPVPVSDSEDWGNFMEHDKRRVIGRATIGDLEVCTDMVGFNLAVGVAFSKGPPMLWETIVFRGRSAELTRRYTSREAAVIGHAEVVEVVKKAGEH